LLDRRAFNRTVRAKYAAVPRLRFEQCAAGFAFIEKLAGIGRHGFRFGMPAAGADDGRFEDDDAHSFTLLIKDGYPTAFGRFRQFIRCGHCIVELHRRGFAGLINRHLPHAGNRLARTAIF